MNDDPGHGQVFINPGPTAVGRARPSVAAQGTSAMSIAKDRASHLEFSVLSLLVYMRSLREKSEKNVQKIALPAMRGMRFGGANSFRMSFPHQPIGTKDNVFSESRKGVAPGVHSATKVQDSAMKVQESATEVQRQIGTTDSQREIDTNDKSVVPGFVGWTPGQERRKAEGSVRESRRRRISGTGPEGPSQTRSFR
jgi:hypothetical protein